MLSTRSGPWPTGAPQHDRMNITRGLPPGHRDKARVLSGCQALASAGCGTLKTDSGQWEKFDWNYSHLEIQKVLFSDAAPSPAEPPQNRPHRPNKVFIDYRPGEALFLEIPDDFNLVDADRIADALRRVALSSR